MKIRLNLQKKKLKKLKKELGPLVKMKSKAIRDTNEGAKADTKN